ncbi:MAG TPA: thioesterase domain-containing protein [Longimicrobium sp.]|jgi:medium-chain acyl-[acyl-carrier-protein] hydrolase
MSRPGPPDPWIQHPRPRPGARLRLFCLAHAGAGASTFRGWADALPAAVEVCPVQLPGRENRMAERSFDRMDPLVEALGPAVLRSADLPFAVFGHSNGALIGFELARRLRREGAPRPVHLFASGRRAPDVPPRTPPTHRLPDDQFLADLRTLGGIPEQVLAHTELLALLLPLLRADVALNETYEFREEPPLELPITAYTGLADARAPREDVEAWARHTARAFTVRGFPGGHFFIFSERDRVLETLARDLEGVVRGL